jgi:predicted DNA-binding transcriptional regulator AlpA
MRSSAARQPRQQQARADRTASTPRRHLIRPTTLSSLLNQNPATTYRQERAKKLPPRDVFIAGRAVGWWSTTIEQVLRRPK